MGQGVRAKTRRKRGLFEQRLRRHYQRKGNPTSPGEAGGGGAEGLFYEKGARLVSILKEMGKQEDS